MGVGGLVMTVHAIHGATDALDGTIPVGAEVLNLLAVGTGGVNGDDGLVGGVGGDKLDVGKVSTVDAADAGEGVDAADVEGEHGLGRRVLFVFTEGGLDEKAIADEASGSVALLAGFAGGIKLREGRDDGAREGVERDGVELPGASHLGVDEVSGTAADVALRAFVVR